MENKTFIYQKRIIKSIAIIVAIRAAINLWFMLLSWLGLINALLEGRIVEGSPDFWTILLGIISVVVNIMMLSFAWNLFTLYESSRIGMVWLLAGALLLIFGGMLSKLIQGDMNKIALPGITIINVIVYAAFIIILLRNDIKIAFPEPVTENWEAHQRRIIYFKQIKKSWKRRGVYDNWALLPVALLNFIFAPSAYLFAFLYYILFVLPRIPRLPKK